jgi:pimeloyl-ACP methyl ester carboxylesterase
LQAGDYQLIADAFKRTSPNPEAFTSEDLEAYRNAAAKRGALTAMINYYRNIFEFFGKEQSWQILRIPTLMIWGEKDAFLGKELTYGTEEYVQDLTIHYLPEASHWVQQDQPDLVNQYIWEFLRSAV